MMTRSALVQREHHWCLQLNGWCTHRAVRLYFKAVSRLGDGVFWYAMMAVLAVLVERSVQVELVVPSAMETHM